MLRKTHMAAVGAIALAAATSIGCYNPDIKDGGLGCAGSEPRCPAGYTCANRGDGDRCWKGGGGGGGGNGGQGGSGGGGGTGGGGANPDGPSTSDGGEAGSCPGIPGCTPSVTSVCDPVCQVNCPCDQRCTVKGGKPECSAGGARKLGETCNASIDNCEAGLVCLEDSCGPGGRGNRCYKFCRSHDHCGTPRAYCSLEIYFNNMPTGYKICDAPITGCNPVGAAASVGCGAYQGCYLIGPDETGCDCAGTLDFGATCTYDRECKPGLICLAAAGGSMGTCRRICNIASPTECAVGRACRPVFTGSTRYGACD